MLGNTVSLAAILDYVNPEIAMSIVVAAAAIFGIGLFLASRYKRCPSNKILVIYGQVDKG